MQVPNDEAVLFVDDGRPTEIFYMKVDGEGRPGEIKPVPLNAAIENPEGITYGGGYFYIAGSQSDPKKSAGHGLGRFAFDPGDPDRPGADRGDRDLRSFLIENVPALKGAGELPGIEGGLNIEGIGWDPVHERLLLGLRSPVVNDQALLVPINSATLAAPSTERTLWCSNRGPSL